MSWTSPGPSKLRSVILLTQQSGLPDVNSFPDYADILAAHQTPDTLVAKGKGLPLLFEPGTKFLHEEHSAYNLLALIVEEKTGLDFRHAMRQLVFEPARMMNSGLDDDSVVRGKIARGYEPESVSGLTPAMQIHWSAKSGNASVYTTIADEERFVQRLFHGKLLSDASLKVVLETSPRVGYGWFRGTSQRFKQIAYYMNGRAPGYASFVLYLPEQELTVVVLSNIYSSATTSIGNDIAAISLGLPYVPFRPMSSIPNATLLESGTGNFQFESDFYRPGAVLTLANCHGELTLRWPDGSLSPLILIDRDHFIDRSYWENVTDRARWQRASKSSEVWGIPGDGCQE